MKEKNLPHTLSFLLCLSFLSVTGQHQNKTDIEFKIPVEKSNLFVRIVGNTNKPLIIDLHGGPGAFSGFNHEFYGPYLEDDYLIAYLDQRGGGRSDVCKDTSLLTMDQFVRDLDVVVDTLRERYNGKKINLLGASWGGTYGLLYLIAHQDKINSFACVSGKADGIYQNLTLIEHEKQLAKKLLDNSVSSNDKRRYQDILTKLEEIKASGFKKFYNDVNLLKHTFPKELGFNVYWANKTALANAAKYASDSAIFSRAHYTKKTYDSALEKMDFVNEVFRNTESYNHLNILDEMAVINKPVLVIQGEYDYAVGVGQAKIIYAALKNVPATQKELVIIPNSAHNLNLEAPDAFFGTVKSFFDKHNK